MSARRVSLGGYMLRLQKRMPSPRHADKGVFEQCLATQLRAIAGNDPNV